MDGNPTGAHAKERLTADAAPGASPALPERLGGLYRRFVEARRPAGSPAFDLPDLAGCYDYDL